MTTQRKSYSRQFKIDAVKLVTDRAKRARERLGLPKEPEVRVTMEVPVGNLSPPSRVQPFEVQPGKVLPGGGMERTATGDIPVKILDVREY